MEPWLIGLFLRPFAALVIFGLIALPIELLIGMFPDSRVKRILLRPIGRQTKTQTKSSRRQRHLHVWRA